MAVVAFDTLKLADRLEAGGFTAVQARTAAGAFADAMSGSDLATKADLGEAKAELKGELGELKAELKGELGELKAELKGDIAALKANLAETKAELRADLVEIEHHLNAKIAAVKAELKGDIAAVKAELQGDIAGVKADVGRLEERIERRAAESDGRMVRYVVGTGLAAMITVVGAAWTIIRYLPPHP
jgi:hypothetical protein